MPLTSALNTSSSSLQIEDELEFYYFYQTEQLTFLWIIFIMIIFGNSLVIGLFLTSKRRKSRMNFFIIHLAFADLLVGFISVLTDIAWRTTVGFFAGNLVCKMIKFLQVLVTYGSTYVLVSLSIDRYDAITHPLNFSNQEKQAKLSIAIAWCLSCLFSIPALFLNQVELIKNQPQCWIDLDQNQWRIYITLVAVSLFFIPAIIISTCYFLIVYTIWTKNGYIESDKRHSKGSTDATVIGDNPGQNFTAHYQNMESDLKRVSSRGVIPKAKIKTIKMTFVIVLVFILCWSPYFVWDLLQVYGYIPKTQRTIAVSTFIQSLAPLNSAANPIIYCLFSTGICRNLRQPSFFDWLESKLSFCLPNFHKSMPKNTTKNNFANTVTSSYIQSLRVSINVKTKVNNHAEQTRLTKLEHSKIKFSNKLEDLKDISDLDSTELTITQSRL